MAGWAHEFGPVRSGSIGRERGTKEGSQALRRNVAECGGSRYDPVRFFVRLASPCEPREAPCVQSCARIGP